MSYTNSIIYDNRSTIDNYDKLTCDIKVDVFYKLKHMLYRLNILESIVNDSNYLLKQPILKRDTNIIINDDDIDNLMVDIKNRLHQVESKLPYDITKTLCEHRLDHLEKYIYNVVQNKIFDEN